MTDSVSKISEIVARHTSKLKDNATTRKMALAKLKANAIVRNHSFLYKFIFPGIDFDT